MAGSKVAVAWFRPEDYDRIREISQDDMIATFEEFEVKMKGLLGDLQTRGISFEKTMINPDELLAYARAKHGGRIDTKIRSEFAALLIHQKYNPDH